MSVHEFVSPRRRTRTTDHAMPRPPVDTGGGGGNDDGMETRVSALEAANLDTRERLARIETRLDFVATKDDLHREISAQTWKLVTFVCGFGTALVAATYFLATHAK
ncbi:hypothetical protein [Burkholderia gladioli]|uniref:hypothetical protein n=1 Tax=Burkholderia gladioli TaxID=28095 RepID=UPI001641BEFE|nr:hypothetical protein [Burkholderia gladioli]